MKNAPGLSRFEHITVDQAPGLRPEREVHAQNVHPRGNVCRGRRNRDGYRAQRALDPQLTCFRFVHQPVFAGDATAPQDDAHAKRRRPPDHFAADVSGPEQPERPAVEPAGLRILRFVPDTGAQISDVVRHSTIQCEDERERKLRYRNGILSRAIRDVDAASGGRGDINRVVAGTGADDERQAPGVEHRGGHRGSAHDQDVGARGADGVRERSSFSSGS